MTSSFRAAVEAKDLGAMRDALHPDVVFRSPVVYKPYEGREAVSRVLAAAVEVFEDFRYVAEVTEGDREVLVFEARVGERELQGVDILRLNDDGLVAELIVMVRPMSGMLALAEGMRARLAPASG